MSPRRSSIAIGLVLVAIGLAACRDADSASENTPSSSTYLGTLAAGIDDAPDALLEGAVVEEDGCIQLRDQVGDIRLAVWPSGFDLADEEILDQNGEVVASVGASLEGASGGQISLNTAQNLVSEPIPASCESRSVVLIGELTSPT
jgi:hypothetical protein